MVSNWVWNDLTYERRQQFFDGETVWETEDYRKRYIGVLGSASAQQAIRKNDQAWNGFFDSDEPDKGLPGYWGNKDEGRDLFDRFRETTHDIAEYQSKLREGRYSSDRIRRLYRRRTRRRDHAQDALARDLMERLHAEGVSTVYVGALKGVLGKHWSVEVNAKTHNFWAFRAFIDRLAYTAAEFGITVEVKPEANTTRECPECGEREDTVRSGDSFWCPCGYEGHADLDASAKFLAQETSGEVGSMARPARLKWDDHRWSELSRSRPNEVRAHQQKTSVGSTA